MYRPKLAIFTLILLAIFLYIHLEAMAFHWYLRFPSLDLITHFMGGVVIALSTFYVLRKTKHIVLISILGGIAWEIFEVYFEITGWPIHSLDYKIDTFIDMIMDTLGALSVWYFLKIKK